MNILASVEEQELQIEGYEKKLPPNEDFTNNFNILWLFAARRSWPTLRTSSTSLQTDVCRALAPWKGFHHLSAFWSTKAIAHWCLPREFAWHSTLLDENRFDRNRSFRSSIDYSTLSAHVKDGASFCYCAYVLRRFLKEFSH